MSRRAGFGSEFLLEAHLKPNTRDAYMKAVRRFMTHLEDHGEDFATIEELDAALCFYFHACYVEKDGKGKQDASNCRNGIVMLYPGVKGLLYRADRCIKGWSKLVPSVPYPPITWELTVLLAMCMVLDGRSDYADATLVAFDAMLRGHEVVGLLREDVVDTGDARVGPEYKGMGLSLRQTKTGPNKFVTVRDPAVQELLRRRVCRLRPGQRVFPFTTDQFRRVFKETCAALGLSSAYVPHSLRHGGATRLHLRGWSIEDIMLRGRWASTKSARHYIQSGNALLLQVRVPQDLAKLGVLFAADLLHSYALAQKH
jgi:hypothetical protein